MSKADERTLLPWRAVGERDAQGRRQGAWRVLDDDNIVRTEIAFVDDEPHGALRRFHPDAAILETGTFDHGRREGTFEAFYGNGDPWYRYTFEGDAPTGEWMLWHPGTVLSRRIDWSIRVVEVPFSADDSPDDDDARANDEDAPARRMTTFSYDGSVGRVIISMPEDLELPDDDGMPVFLAKEGGFFWLNAEGRRLLKAVQLPPLRPLMATTAGGLVVNDFDLTSEEVFDHRHSLGIISPFRLSTMKHVEMEALAMRYRERTAELAEVCGEPVRLPPMIWAVSDGGFFQNEVPHNGLEGTLLNWGRRRLKSLATSYARLGYRDHARAAADAAGGPMGLAKTALRYVTGSPLEEPIELSEGMTPAELFAEVVV